MLKLKRFDQGIWYDFPDNPGVRLKIKPLNRKDILDIRAGAKRKMSIQMGEKAEVVDDYNEADFIWKLFKNVLQEWEGIEYEQNDLQEKITKDDYVLAIFNHDPLREFIFEKANEAYQSEETKIGEELKNSESSQAG